MKTVEDAFQREFSELWDLMEDEIVDDWGPAGHMNDVTKKMIDLDYWITGGVNFRRMKERLQEEHEYNEEVQSFYNGRR